MRVTVELRYGRDVVVGHNTVGQIMRELGIKGLPARRLPKGARVPQVTSLDLVRRELRSDRGVQFTSWAFSEKSGAPVWLSRWAVGSAYEQCDGRVVLGTQVA